MKMNNLNIKRKKKIYKRNQLWLPSIEDKISQYNCLVAVGANHLFYKAGLITVLRA